MAKVALFIIEHCCLARLYFLQLFRGNGWTLLGCCGSLVFLCNCIVAEVGRLRVEHGFFDWTAFFAVVMLQRPGASRLNTVALVHSYSLQWGWGSAGHLQVMLGLVGRFLSCWITLVD